MRHEDTCQQTQAKQTMFKVIKICCSLVIGMFLAMCVIVARFLLTPTKSLEAISDISSDARLQNHEQSWVRSSTLKASRSDDAIEHVAPKDCFSQIQKSFVSSIDESDLLKPLSFNQSILDFAQTAMYDNIFKKLTARECIKVVALGGSVTCGRGEKTWQGESLQTRLSSHDRPYGAGTAWPAWLGQLLDDSIPCCSRDTQGVTTRSHEVINLCEAAVGSDFWIDKLSEGIHDRSEFFLHVQSADLVIVETALNDCLSCSSLHNPDRDAETTLSAEKVYKYTEILVSMLLRLKVAILYLGVSDLPRLETCRDSVNPRPPWTGCAVWDGTLPRTTDAIALHRNVTRYYGVPYVSAIDGLGPFVTDEQQQWLMNKYKIDGTHVTILGQKIIANLVANFVFEQWRRVVASTDRLPVWVTQAQIDMYMKSTPLHISTVQDRDASRRKEISGFYSGEDVRGKPGLLGSAVGDHVVYAVTPPEVARHVRSGVLHVASLKSYKGMGVMKVTVSSRRAKPVTVRGERVLSCDIDTGSATVLASAAIDCLWDEHVSEQATDEVTFALPSGVAGGGGGGADGDGDVDVGGAAGDGGAGELCLYVSIQIVEAGRAENKVKLLSFSLY